MNETISADGERASGRCKESRNSARKEDDSATWDEIQAGTTIGPYRLIRTLGEGGMGIVFLAEQRRPLQRKVALKVIRAGMDTKEVIGRFDAERQALALMDHPNIARVLDAGTTDGGRPFFVMELVQGLPITDFCDKHRLGLQERLELFISVCQGIQHAHQKGIVHRDIKPTNVLITMQNDHPVPKVIDFGIAKAIGQGLTEKTLYTAAGQLVGTLQYMSPEQLEFRGYDIDTRSDIYSLGVLLYEMLAGKVPVEVNMNGTLGLEEMLRRLRETDPVKPSSRVETLEKGKIERVAQARSTQPGRLPQALKGDLDWIVLKALEKDRTRRYETANGFLLDVRRFLNDEPVTASPPTIGYLCRKYVNRHRGPLVAGAIITSALMVGTGISVWQAIRATAAEGLAEERLEEVEREKQSAIIAKDDAERASIRAQLAENLANKRLEEVQKERQEAIEARDKAEEASARAQKAEELASSRLTEVEKQRKEALDAKERAEDLYAKLKAETDLRMLSEQGRESAEKTAATERERVEKILAFLRSQEIRRELLRSDPDGLQLIQSIDRKIGEIFAGAERSFAAADFALSKEFGAAALENLDLDLESARSSYQKALRLVTELESTELSESDRRQEEALLMVRLARVERLLGQGDSCLQYLNEMEKLFAKTGDQSGSEGVRALAGLERGLLLEYLGDEEGAHAAAAAVLNVELPFDAEEVPEIDGSSWALRSASLLARTSNGAECEKIATQLLANLPESMGEGLEEVSEALSVRRAILEAQLALSEMHGEKGDWVAAYTAGLTPDSLLPVLEVEEFDPDQSPLRIAVTELESHVMEFPSDRHLRILLLEGHRLLGQVERGLGNDFEALRCFEKCRAEALAMMRRDEDLALPLDRVLRASYGEAAIYRDAGEHGKSLEALQIANDSLCEAESRGLGTDHYRSQYAQLYRQMVEATIRRFYVVSGSRGTLEENTFYADKVDYLGNERFDRRRITEDQVWFRDRYPMRFYEVDRIEGFEGDAEKGFSVTVHVYSWLGRREIKVAEPDDGGIYEIGLTFDDGNRLRISRIAELEELDVSDWKGREEL